jgi:acyl-coenzyme A thioesterase PaaI-like protein
MNDKPATAETAVFDPARAGWKIVKPIGFGELVGPIWRNGDARFGVLVEAKHLNFADIVHGGMLITLADQAMGMTALRATGNKPHATIELNMQFVSAVRLNEFVKPIAKSCG